MSDEERQSAILLHLSSIPSGHGIGALGLHARRFADFLADAGQRIWQVLPLNPTDAATGNSPYSSPSAFASNPLLISPGRMVHDGVLSRNDVPPPPPFRGGWITPP